MGAIGRGAPTGWPQLEQNFAPGSSPEPQLAHLAAKDVPQLEQNFASSRFNVPQFGHFMSRPLFCTAYPEHGRNASFLLKHKGAKTQRM
jgi:hypothetical protein